MSKPHQFTLDAFNYLGVQEQIYSTDHPDIIRYTEYFKGRLSQRRIFETFWGSINKPDIASARAVATQWYRFSSFMPYYLCQACALVSSNEKRHYIIQTAFEELGMREVTEIHPEMFWSSVELTGITHRERIKDENYESVTIALRELKHSLLCSHSDDHILGILLGLEMPAEENIETVFSSLAYTEELKSALAQTKFFQLHRPLEIEHIRLTLSNFLRFSSTEDKKIEFIKGFDAGLEFWFSFWTAIQQLTLAKRRVLL